MNYLKLSVAIAGGMLLYESVSTGVKTIGAAIAFRKARKEMKKMFKEE